MAGLNGIWGTSATNMIAVGDNGTALRSGDGQNWEATAGNAANDVFAVGQNGYTVQCAGTGAWVHQRPSSGPYLNATWGTSGSDVYAVGSGGYVLHYNGSTCVPLVDHLIPA